MCSDGVESIYWAGTESGLMNIYNFPGVIYATDGSKGSMEMGALYPPGGCNWLRQTAQPNVFVTHLQAHPFLG